MNDPVTIQTKEQFFLKYVQMRPRNAFNICSYKVDSRNMTKALWGKSGLLKSVI